MLSRPCRRTGQYGVNFRFVRCKTGLFFNTGQKARPLLCFIEKRHSSCEKLNTGQLSRFTCTHTGQKSCVKREYYSTPDKTPYCPVRRQGRLLSRVFQAKFLNIKHKITCEGGLHLSLIHISEPTRQEAISYAVFCLKKKNITLARKKLLLVVQ